MRSKLLLSFLFLSSSIFAQENFHYVMQQRHGRVNDIAVDQGRIVAGGSEESCRMPVLSFFEPDGALAWEITPYDCGYCKVDDVTFAENGDILLGGDQRVADDTGAQSDGLVVARFDTFGNRLAYQEMAFYPIFHPVCILELPNGQVLAGGEHYLFGFSAELDSLFTWDFPFGGNEYFLEIDLVNDTTIALLTPNRVFLTNWEGEVQEEIPAPAGAILVDLEVLGDSLLLMSTASLYFYDRNTASLTFLNLPQGSTRGLLLNQDTVRVWGAMVHQLTESGDWQQAYELYSEEKSTSQLVYENGAFYRGGEDILELPQGNGYLNFQMGYIEKVATPEMPPALVHDIGISNVQMVEIISESIYEDVPGLYILIYNFRFSVEVTNYGNMEVNSFVIASEKQGGFNCDEGRFFTMVDSVSLLPGQSIIVENPMTEYRYSSSPNLSFELERCFFIGGPNHQFDRDYSNNQYCGVVLVGTEETEKPLSLRLYPNPATDLLYVELDADIQIEAYSWINAAGQVVGQASVAPTSKLELQRPGPAGMYWLRVVSRDGVGYQAVVWR